MIGYRNSGLVAVLALGAATLALAQSTPPAGNSPSNSNPPSSQTAPDSMSSGSDSMSPASSKLDPKTKQCIASEKAKNSGQSDNQIKQKCMMQIGSHQGQDQGH